jgi:type III secretion protein V
MNALSALQARLRAVGRGAPAVSSARPAARSMPQRLAQRGDALVIGLIVAIIALMVLPIPLVVLDLLIAVNIAASVCLLMMAVYVPSAVSLTTFPNLLLFTTLLRLSLNIASTKQILLHAHAGHIIETFGRLVVGGNALVGGVVFVIIAVVQFIVIAKGGERVAEVGARFTLDGMPGKQMSIDADLRAGLITKDEAKQRRLALEHESQWHGAMDGAMKFVKGDAICGLIIAFVNILAGIAVGVGMKGMALGQAVQRYTLLTVGDGMVSQIPSLFVCVAAGILITRVASSGERGSNVGRDIMLQVVSQPMALVMTGSVLLAFLVVPGFPKLQFFVLGALIGVGGLFLLRGERHLDAPHRAPVPQMRGDAERLVPSLVQQEPERLAAPVLVQLAPSVQHLVEPQAFGAALAHERGRLYESIGLPFPGLRLRYDPALPENGWRILAQDIPVAEGVLPAVGAEHSASELLAQRVGEAIRARAGLFVGIQDVQAMLDDISRNQPDLVQEVTRALPLQRIADVMRRLLQENLSIRNTREILESLIVWAPREKDVTLLVEYVRIDIGAMTLARIAGSRAELPIVMLSQATEQVVRESIQQTLGGAFLALGPERSDALLRQAKQWHEQARENGLEPVFACSMDVRRHVKRALEPVLPQVPVLSYQEIGEHVRVNAVGAIEIDATGERPAITA